MIGQLLFFQWSVAEPWVMTFPCRDYSFFLYLHYLMLQQILVSSVSMNIHTNRLPKNSSSSVSHLKKPLQPSKSPEETNSSRRGAGLCRGQAVINKRWSQRIISVRVTYPPYKNKYIIKKGSAVCFQLPSNHLVVGEETKFHAAHREEAIEVDSWGERGGVR